MLCDLISKEERIVTVLCVFCRYFNSPLADVKIQSSNGMFTFDVLHCSFCTNCVRLMSDKAGGFENRSVCLSVCLLHLLWQCIMKFLSLQCIDTVGYRKGICP